MDVGGNEVGDAGVDSDGGVEEGDLTTGGFGLGKGVAGVGLVEEDLALEVGGFDEVSVDEGEDADAGAGEERGGGSSGGSDADDGDVGAGEKGLASGSDAGEDNLTGVAGFVGDGTAGCGWAGGAGGEGEIAVGEAGGLGHERGGLR